MMCMMKNMLKAIKLFKFKKNYSQRKKYKSQDECIANINLHD